MSMRLLPKSEIDRAKAADRKRDIDEGSKLAKSIDSLREVRAQEETSLETFRRETVSNLNEEIGKKRIEKDTLDHQIEQRKIELKKLQEPLDLEWALVHVAQGEIDEQREAQDAREGVLKSKEQDAEQTLKKATGVLARANTKDDLANARLSDTQRDSDAAKLALEIAIQAKERSEEIAQIKHKELTHRDLLASGRERDVTIREQRASEREAENSAEMIRLADMRATLERALKRIK